jgi:hypothetical protein
LLPPLFAFTVEIAARKKIAEYPHILPGGALRHCVMIGDVKSTNKSKKKNFHEILLSHSGLCPVVARFLELTCAAPMADPLAFVKNHRLVRISLEQRALNVNPF